MMKFSLVDRGDAHSIDVANHIKNKCEIDHWIYDESNPEIVICVGGDGTLLRAIHKYIGQLETIYFIGIHTGTLGFFTDYTQNEIEQLIEDMNRNEPYCEESSLLELRINNEERLYALNEFRIESFSRTLKLDIYLDHEFFERSTGSGICICSQSGSTAINRALGGAIIDDGLEAMELCEIMPISHKNHHSLRNPYIMNTKRRITICSDELEEAQLSYDYLERSLKGVKSLEIRTSQKKVRFIRYRPYSYLTRLKNLY